MFPMIATKMLSYDNRRLVPGQDFIAKSHRDMKVLLATRKAKIKREEVELAPPPAAVAAKIEATIVPPQSELAQLREAYKEKIGKQPFYGWDAAALREKIASASVDKAIDEL